MADIETLLADTRYYAEAAAPGTPAAGNVVTYAKADGLMYSKDDAGTETLMSVGAGGGITTGTTFPGTPGTGDQYRRSDIDYEVFTYDGTRWRSDVRRMVAMTDLLQLPYSATIAAAVVRLGTDAAYDWYIYDIACATRVATTNDGSNYYTVEIIANPGTNTLGSFTTASDTADVFTQHKIAENAVLDTTTYKVIQAKITNTLSPGAINAFNVMVDYAIIAT